MVGAGGPAAQREGDAHAADGQVSATAWHLRIGGPWRALPGDVPAWRTVYNWF